MPHSLPEPAIRTGLCCLATLLWLNTAAAAPPPNLTQQRPGDTQLELPAFEPETAPPALQLPPVPAPPPDAGLSRQAQVFVREFRLEGNTVFSAAQLAELTAPYTGRAISTGELQELRYRLTLFYIDHGYINSGAIIPDQQVTDGIVTLRIIEGTLNDIAVSGTQRLRPDYISNRVAPGAGPPLNISRLGEQLQILEQNPRIERLNAVLEPGAQPGESRLSVQVREAKPYELWLDAGNTQSPAVGASGAGLRGVHRNLSGRGDTLELALFGTEGLREWSTGYTLPVTATDTTLGIHWHSIDSEIIEEPFNVLDLTSDETTLGLLLQHPLRHTLNETVTLGLGLDVRRSQTQLLGSPFTLPGTDQGESRLSVLRLSQEWLRRGRNQVFAARSLLSTGIDAFDATVNGEPGDGEFVAWLGQFQWARRLSRRDIQLVFRADAQAASGPLPSMEQFTVGGAQTVRGYRKNRLVADTGFVASLEARVPFYTSTSGELRLQVVPFADYGYASNRSGGQPPRHDIASAGLGLLGNWRERVEFSLYYGHAFQDFVDGGGTLQDHGFSLALSAKLM